MITPANTHMQPYVDWFFTHWLWAAAVAVVLVSIAVAAIVMDLLTVAAIAAIALILLGVPYLWSFSADPARLPTPVQISVPYPSSKEGNTPK